MECQHLNEKEHLLLPKEGIL